MSNHAEGLAEAVVELLREFALGKICRDEGHQLIGESGLLLCCGPLRGGKEFGLKSFAGQSRLQNSSAPSVDGGAGNRFSRYAQHCRWCFAAFREKRTIKHVHSQPHESLGTC